MKPEVKSGERKEPKKTQSTREKRNRGRGEEEERKEERRGGRDEVKDKEQVET